ncbi:MAG: methylmalonyl Co-A mutase-associated GTPase MeaB [Candidatus Delongbacteria bacterium]|jgi:LAO/AO transport system kinase|nr:methylmalonyl Co-A mutase-associated GTPase MeaB [Candidatus Delongbacteria bacterium]
MNNKNKTSKSIDQLAKDNSSSLNINAGKEKPTGISGDNLKYIINKKRKKYTLSEYTDGILKGDRVVLGRALTLIESKIKEDNILSNKIIDKSLPYSGKSIRIGITGIPGVGKSTFIEAFGLYLLDKSKKVAVMAVDPSSNLSRGSLMGDKTRMEKLSSNPDVFIRPSATSGFLGGVNRATREAIILCEAAGYDIIIIETVGVGQSEVLVHSMVDFFLLLQIAGAGDELQGIKKGIVEMADAIAVSKSDGDNILKAKLCKQELENATHYSLNYDPDWQIPITTISSQDNIGIDKVWETIQKHNDIMSKNGKFEEKRKLQLNQWLQTTISQTLENSFYNDIKVMEEFKKIKKDVIRKTISPIVAAEKLIKIFIKE